MRRSQTSTCGVHNRALLCLQWSPVLFTTQTCSIHDGSSSVHNRALRCLHEPHGVHSEVLWCSWWSPIVFAKKPCHRLAFTKELCQIEPIVFTLESSCVHLMRTCSVHLMKTCSVHLMKTCSVHLMRTCSVHIGNFCMIHNGGNVQNELQRCSLRRVCTVYNRHAVSYSVHYSSCHVHLGAL